VANIHNNLDPDTNPNANPTHHTNFNLKVNFFHVCKNNLPLTTGSNYTAKNVKF